MPLTQTALDQMDAHAPYILFLGLVLMLGLIATVLAILEALAKRRERRAAAERDAAEWKTRRDGIAEGFRRGWHG